MKCEYYIHPAMISRTGVFKDVNVVYRIYDSEHMEFWDGNNWRRSWLAIEHIRLNSAPISEIEAKICTL